jgi:hypothetical protein
MAAELESTEIWGDDDVLDEEILAVWTDSAMHGAGLIVVRCILHSVAILRFVSLHV